MPRNYIRLSPARAISAIAGLMASAAASATAFTFTYESPGPGAVDRTTVTAEFTGLWNDAVAKDYVTGVTLNSLTVSWYDYLGFGTYAPTSRSGTGPFSILQYYTNGGTGGPDPGAPGRIYSDILQNNFVILDCEITFGASSCSDSPTWSINFLLRQGLGGGDESIGLTVDHTESSNGLALLKLDRAVGSWAITEIPGSDEPVSVPEPGTLALLGMGLLGLAWRRRVTSG